MAVGAQEALDDRVRLRVFERLLDDGRAPSVIEIAADLRITPQVAAESYRRLAGRRRLVLRPGSMDILMAHPLSAVPTPFTVETHGRSYFGNCIWDALAIIGMLGDSGRVITSCGDGCGEVMTIAIAHGEPVDPQGIIHFQVARAHWWDDIVFT